MKMKEAEARTGLDRKNIRYYESEELLAPRRTEGNRYRDYSEEDIQRLLEIRFLRQLGIPIRDIRGYFEGRLSVSDLMRMRLDRIDGEMSQLKKLEQICSRLEEQQTLKPSIVESCLEEFSREDGNTTWLEDIRKDYPAGIHLCPGPAGGNSLSGILYLRSLFPPWQDSSCEAGAVHTASPQCFQGKIHVFCAASHHPDVWQYPVLSH